MIVVDASAVLEVLLASADCTRIADRMFAPGESLHAPHLLDLPLTRYPHEPLLARVWELRENVTAYDAAYLALAEALDAPLVTRDARLKAAPGHSARVDVV